MSKRFLAIWFPHLKTDRMSRRQPALLKQPFVLVISDHGRIVISAANTAAKVQGIDTGMTLADARAIIPSLIHHDDNPALAPALLKSFATWCIRYTPYVAVDEPDGLILNITGCAHLWGGEEKYLAAIYLRLKSFGYDIRTAIADTTGAAWAVSRYGENNTVVAPGKQAMALLSLPPAALRLETTVLERLYKLGMRNIISFINLPRPAMRRRFGANFLQRLDQALGLQEEVIQPVQPIEPWQERLPCLEPVVTRTAIELALQQLLEKLCQRLQREEKGLRQSSFTGYRVDGKTVKITIGTNRVSRNVSHLFKLFEPRLENIEPALGIELFVLDALTTEELTPLQEKLWEVSCGLEDPGLSELMDRIANKIGMDNIHRYIADEHYWPERSVRLAANLYEKTNIAWKSEKPRPVWLLKKPEPIYVSVPVPDYPPLLFHYKSNLHIIKKADGPERIEREWWLEEGPHRDYYCVEDEQGHRYWLFRSGHYSDDTTPQWFIHGFFA